MYKSRYFTLCLILGNNSFIIPKQRKAVTMEYMNKQSYINVTKQNQIEYQLFFCTGVYCSHAWLNTWSHTNTAWNTGPPSVSGHTCRSWSLTVDTVTDKNDQLYMEKTKTHIKINEMISTEIYQRISVSNELTDPQLPV